MIGCYSEGHAKDQILSFTFGFFIDEIRILVILPIRLFEKIEVMRTKILKVFEVV